MNGKRERGLGAERVDWGVTVSAGDCEWASDKGTMGFFFFG